MIVRQKASLPVQILLALILSCLLGYVHASVGDRLPEFQECIEVCKQENCDIGEPSIPLHHRLLLWNCDSECDHTCQHIITDQRVAEGLPIVQFHGKWPFYRFLGMQEPFSVLFSLFNFLGHYFGLEKMRAAIPASYPLRQYYCLLAQFGMASWVFSMIFHTRDFKITEELDYLAAGGSVLYGLYYPPIRMFHLADGGKKARSVLRAWTVFCALLYVGHVTYLKSWAWDYTYNMAANVVVGIASNILWTAYSIQRYRKLRRAWAATPGLVVAWIIVAMSLELLDFPPLLGCVDAHSLWHLGTVVPTFLFYDFLIKDAQDDVAGARLKA